MTTATPKMATTKELEPKRPILTAADRCDKCGARGYAQTQHLEGLLTWCGHHFTEHEERLALVSIGILDERWVLMGGESARNEDAEPRGMGVGEKFK